MELINNLSSSELFTNLEQLDTVELRSDNIYKQGSVVILDVSKEYLLYQIESDEGRFVIGMNNLTEPVHLNREPGELTNFLDPEAAVDFVIPARGIIIYRSK